MNIDKLQKIDHYIQEQRTGSPEDFAMKLAISKSMLHRYLKYLKTELKAPVSYNRFKETYQYDEAGFLAVKEWIPKTNN